MSERRTDRPDWARQAGMLYGARAFGRRGGELSGYRTATAASRDWVSGATGAGIYPTGVPDGDLDAFLSGYEEAFQSALAKWRRG